MRMRYGSWMAVAGILWGTACASVPKTPADAVQGELTDAPDWVRKGCEAWWGDKKEPRICGVGA
ncbi:MAG TPA: hypothetical protein VGD74_11125, partial [Vulgatibacter sp.]